ncbi:hypothetical protein EV182_008565, partial [Spiromyces aspiralis]
TARQTKRHTIQVEYEKLPVSFNDSPTENTTEEHPADLIEPSAAISSDGAAPAASSANEGDAGVRPSTLTQEQHAARPHTHQRHLSSAEAARVDALSKLERGSSSAAMATTAPKGHHSILSPSPGHELSKSSSRAAELSHPARVRPTSMFAGSMENTIGAAFNSESHTAARDQRAGAAETATDSKFNNYERSESAVSSSPDHKDSQDSDKENL